MTVPNEAWVNAYANWQEAQHRSEYWKALTGAQNRLMRAAEDVERFGYDIVIQIVETPQIDEEPFLSMYNATKDRTVGELTALGWKMILTPPA